MDWQQVISIGIVAVVALLLTRHLLRQRSRMSMCSECACAVEKADSNKAPAHADGSDPMSDRAEFATFMRGLKVDSGKSTLRYK